MTIDCLAKHMADGFKASDKKLERLTELMVDGFNEVDKRFDRNEAQMNGMHTQMEGMQMQMNNIETDIKSIKLELKEIIADSMLLKRARKIFAATQKRSTTCAPVFAAWKSF